MTSAIFPARYRTTPRLPVAVREPQPPLANRACLDGW
jgi:hypothetical protein